jgi:hypothetical protein
MERARGALAGACCGLGALAAHRLGGGAVPPGLTVLLVLTASVGLGVVVTRRGTTPARLTVLAVAAQAGWHLLLVTTTDCADSLADCRTPGAQAVELAGGLAVAATSVVLALSLDRALVDLGRRLLSRLLVPVPTAATTGPVTARRAGLPAVPLRASLVTTAPTPPRGPPRGAARTP